MQIEMWRQRFIWTKILNNWVKIFSDSRKALPSSKLCHFYGIFHTTERMLVTTRACEAPDEVQIRGSSERILLVTSAWKQAGSKSGDEPQFICPQAQNDHARNPLLSLKSKALKHWKQMDWSPNVQLNNASLETDGVKTWRTEHSTVSRGRECPYRTSCNRNQVFLSTPHVWCVRALLGVAKKWKLSMNYSYSIWGLPKSGSIQ